MHLEILERLLHHAPSSEKLVEEKSPDQEVETTAFPPMPTRDAPQQPDEIKELHPAILQTLMDKQMKEMKKVS